MSRERDLREAAAGAELRMHAEEYGEHEARLKKIQARIRGEQPAQVVEGAPSAATAYTVPASDRRTE